MTEWAKTINPDHPWNLYPRPYLERSNWINLNGLWDYTITSREADRPESFTGKVLVPFPIESAISGVMERVDQNDRIWYKRSLPILKKESDSRVLLNFEAVDWFTEVWIDGEWVGSHKGGYSPFSFDITDLVHPQKDQELWVAVWDPTTEGTQAVGKQNSQPHGIWYTPSSGIWQTVWLEQVSESYLSDYSVQTDIDHSQITLNSSVVHAQEGDVLEYYIRDEGDLVGRFLSTPGEELQVNLESVKLWTPENPFLYDLEIILKRGTDVLDQVQGYFGMRKISIGKDATGTTRILLNNEFVFQNGPLDQGFWPDGLYTPPTEEAMISDLTILKEMGFNMLRKHVKVENRRFYYWTDKMGLLVWQDMPNAHYGLQAEVIAGMEESRLQFENELRELVLSLDNHPSIVMWVPFNEGWGQYDTERIVESIQNLDPDRLINNASGWTDRGVGHVKDIHHYPNPIAPPAEENRAIVLGEFGGLGLPIMEHTWQEDLNWGYENMEGAESLLTKYEGFYAEIERLKKDPGLSAVVYTQTSDVEIETNGLLSYDRKVDKMGKTAIRKAHQGFTPPFLMNSLTGFITSYKLELGSARPGAQIHYTLDGSVPDLKSPLYSGPITLYESSVVKAMSFWKSGEKSRPTEFLIVKQIPQPAVKRSSEKGLETSFFEGAWEKIPDFGALNPTRKGLSKELNLSLAQGQTQDFGLVFKGYLLVPQTEVYLFSLSSDDGGRLWIDGEQVIDYDGIHGMGLKQISLALEKGLHPIEFHYFQHLGGLGLQLFWESPLLRKEEIGSQFYGH